MQLDKTTDISTNLKKKKTITITNDELTALQLQRVLVFNLIPLLGLIVGIVYIWFGWVKILDIILLVTMYALTVVMGITVGYHRLLSHKAFQTHTVIRFIFAILGSIAGQGPPIYWVANHRRHHEFCDQPGDPHSPHANATGKLSGFIGFFHAYIGWLFDGEITNSLVFAKDLIRDPVINQVNRWYMIWLMLGLIIPAVVGGVLTNSWTGLVSGFLWGGLIRLFLSIQSGYLINSVNHSFGTHPFDSRDRSTNNIWLSIPTGGDAWHHNHHTFPNSAQFGLKWWQIDLGYWVIRSLELMGLAWNVKRTPSAMLEAKKLA
ncbi:MAG: acyl-CoA desaturase [Symploca sp. SIO1A3]|nr:acyl-CoA desaturase [Symploca sp. SIO1A3]